MTLKSKSRKFDFYKTKYGENLLIDLIRLEALEKYINVSYSHYLTYFDITLVTSGKGTFFLDGEKYELENGLVLFSSPGQIRKWNFDHVPEGYVLIFEKAFLTSFLSDPGFVDKLSYFGHGLKNYSIELTPDETAHIVAIFNEIETEIRNFKANDEQILRALLCQVLVWLNRRFNEPGMEQSLSETNRHIRNFVNMVAAKFKREHSVSFYAGALNISSGHLNDLSKSVLRVSAKKYILGIIITEAQKMLITSDSSVSDIALDLGFIDTSYFIRCFRVETGKTPLAFRKKQNL